MKVICIDVTTSSGKNHPYLIFGETYEPSGEGISAISGEECYVLAEMPPTRLNGIYNKLPLYRKTRFVPLSDIDENEFERNYNKEL